MLHLLAAVTPEQVSEAETRIDIGRKSAAARALTFWLEGEALVFTEDKRIQIRFVNPPPS
jgi:hypothetical protein